MNKDTIIKNAEGFISELFENEFSGHDYYHTMRVFRMAEGIARECGADLFIVRLAALLHDADDVKLSPETAETLGNARRFMTAQGVDEKTQSTVCGIISEISFKGADSVTPSTIEGQCVQDADRLDAIGAVGAARTFAYGGRRGRPMYDPNVPPKMEMTEAEYRKSDSSSLNHFYEKLFKLKDMMNTSPAKRIAEARDTFMHEFVDEFLGPFAEHKP